MRKQKGEMKLARNRSGCYPMALLPARTGNTAVRISAVYLHRRQKIERRPFDRRRFLP